VTTNAATANNAMTDVRQLRASISGLLGLAASEEQILLARADRDDVGTPDDWAAAPLVAHNTEFRHQQLQRLNAIQHRTTPPDFAEVDHESAELYADLSARPATTVADESWTVAGELVAQLKATSTDDLCDPERNPWLRGRLLWLQIVVRGFWHPMGHLGEYYLRRGQPDRAVALAKQSVQTASYLGAPDQARGMASYNLACAYAQAGQLEEAVAAVGDAVTLNPDVRINAARDHDLEALRAGGLLAAVLETST